MPVKRKPEHAEALRRNKEENQTLEKLEAGINVKIGDKTINQLYNEKLNETINLKETVRKTVKSQPKIKVEKPVKELTEKGKKASERLSKYREQVKEALQLKKNLENKNLLSYSDDEEEEEETESEVKPLETHKVDTPIVPSKPIPTPIISTQPIQTPIVPSLQTQPQIDLTPIYGEIDNLKKKNKELEDKFMYRNSLFDISNMRRNMSIKF